MAAAGELARPAPLPLVGATPETVVSPDERDATLMGPGSRSAAAGVAAGVAGGALRPDAAGADTAVADLPRQNGQGAPAAPAGFTGADTTHLDLRLASTALRSPPEGVPAHTGGVPPWSSSHGGTNGMSPNDRSARRLMLGAAVVVIAVAVGIVGGWLYMQSQIPSHPVPASLIGMQRDALPTAIDEFHWDISDETVRRDGTQPGQILETHPAAGEMLREGRHAQGGGVRGRHADRRARWPRGHERRRRRGRARRRRGSSPSWSNSPTPTSTRASSSGSPTATPAIRPRGARRSAWPCRPARSSRCPT